MKTVLCSILMLCLAGIVYGVTVKGACDDSNKCDAGLACVESKCMALVSSTCTKGSDNECVATAMCENTTCACPEKKYHTSDKKSCLLKVDQPCSATDQCLVQAPKGICENNKVCKCTADYKMSDDMTKCNSGPRTAIGSIFLVLLTFVMSRLF